MASAKSNGHIKVMVVKDHHMGRDMISQLLETQKRIKVVASSNTKDAVKVYRAHKPGVVVVDFSLPAHEGLQAIRDFRKKAPRAKIVTLGAVEPEGLPFDSIKAGSTGFVAKTCAFKHLVQAIGVVHEGKKFVLGAEDCAFTGPRCSHCVFPVTTELTRRELDVVRLYTIGHNTQDVATTLGISPKTVDTHRHNAMVKTDCKGMADLTRFALRVNLISVY
jgi:two-component system invasion response regulator UvrY